MIKYFAFMPNIFRITSIRQLLRNDQIDNQRADKKAYQIHNNTDNVLCFIASIGFSVLKAVKLYLDTWVNPASS
jgi:hypothetical protein